MNWLQRIGSTSESYTGIPLNDAVSLMEENSNATVRQIKGCNHDFDGKSHELSKIVHGFIEDE